MHQRERRSGPRAPQLSAEVYCCSACEQDTLRRGPGRPRARSEAHFGSTSPLRSAPGARPALPAALSSCPLARAARCGTCVATSLASALQVPPGQKAHETAPLTTRDGTKDAQRLEGRCDVRGRPHNSSRARQYITVAPPTLHMLSCQQCDYRYQAFLQKGALRRNATNWGHWGEIRNYFLCSGISAASSAPGVNTRTVRRTMRSCTAFQGLIYCRSNSQGMKNSAQSFTSKTLEQVLRMLLLFKRVHATVRSSYRALGKLPSTPTQPRETARRLDR